MKSHRGHFHKNFIKMSANEREREDEREREIQTNVAHIPDCTTEKSKLMKSHRDHKECQRERKRKKEKDELFWL